MPCGYHKNKIDSFIHDRSVVLAHKTIPYYVFDYIPYQVQQETEGKFRKINKKYSYRRIDLNARQRLVKAHNRNVSHELKLEKERMEKLFPIMVEHYPEGTGSINLVIDYMRKTHPHVPNFY